MLIKGRYRNECTRLSAHPSIYCSPSILLTPQLIVVGRRFHHGDILWQIIQSLFRNIEVVPAQRTRCPVANMSDLEPFPDTPEAVCVDARQ